MKIFCCLIFMLFLGAPVFAQARSEFQEWNEVQLIYPLVQGKDAKGKTVDKVTATFSGIARLPQIGRSSR